VGRYQLSPTFSLAITRDGTGLFLQATGQDRFGLFASGRNEFFLRAVDASISFERDGADRVIALILHQGGANQRAARLP
jgi:D-alanyl-D-alanine-carboxypeptidase/D-alanyl-D-alanine-endopeptidase